MGFDGVLNGFFFDFLWVSVHGGGGSVVVVVVSLVVVAKVGFICLDFCRGVVAWPWVSVLSFGDDFGFRLWFSTLATKFWR